MALLVLNDFTPVKEISKAITKETQLECVFLYEGLDFTSSEKDFNQIRNQHGKKKKRIQESEKNDFFITTEYTTIQEIQEYVHACFEMEIQFFQNGKKLPHFDKLTNYVININQVDKTKIEALNFKIQSVLEEIFKEMVECIQYFQNSMKNSTTVKDIEIVVEMNFILAKADPIFIDSSDNIVYTFFPFVHTENLNQFKEWYLNWDFTLFYHAMNPSPCANPNRILYELHQKMELIDLQRIDDVLVDVKYSTQRF